jgi:predicted acetyltransferase
MILREIQIGDEVEALRAHEELSADDFRFLLMYEPGMNWTEFIRIHEDFRNGLAPEGMVTANFLLAEDHGEIVGRVSIRHSLNDFLFNYGGHIGYAVRPQFRRKGYATEILKQALEFCRGLGLEKVLVTCNDSNEPSAKTIEKCGGRLENKVTEQLESGERLVRRYWIDL